MQRSNVSDKMKALLNIAARVQVLGKEVKPEDIQAARELGANDREIHDTVLIAATFSMFNRYVDGLASFTPTDPATYEEMGKRMSEKGYVLPANNIKGVVKNGYELITIKKFFMKIKTEPIGSIPRPLELIEGMKAYAAGQLNDH